MSAGILYITYDGILEPLSQSQVLAYLEKLAADRPMHLLSFEKEGDLHDGLALERMQARMDASGIKWHFRRYHKQPASVTTSWDIGVAGGRSREPRQGPHISTRECTLQL